MPPGWRRAFARHAAEPVPGAIDALLAGHGPRQRPRGRRSAPDGGRFVHERFAEQAARRPEAAAVMAGRTRVTYRELDESANRLAHYLAEDRRWARRR